jgi:phage shock protein E
MLNFLKKIFGGEQIDIREKLNQGAVIVDVRTPAEFKSGHMKGAVNIPLDQIYAQMKKLQKYKKPIVAYCRSGNRSSMAVREMKKAGIEAYNGGSLNKMQSL